MLGLFAYLASGGIHSSSTTSEYGSTSLSYGTRKETLRGGTSSLIAPEREFQFQVTYEKAISLIPGLSEGDQGRTSSTSVSTGCGSCTWGRLAVEKKPTKKVVSVLYDPIGISD